MSEQDRGLLGKVGDGIVTGVTAAELMMGVAAPYAPPSIASDPALEAPGIRQEIDPADCPALEGLYELNAEAQERAVDQAGDWMDVQEGRRSEELSDALDEATAFENAMDATPALDLGADAGFDAGVDVGGLDMGGGDAGGMFG